MMKTMKHHWMDQIEGNRLTGYKRRHNVLKGLLKDNGAKIGKQGREITSNITDNESATIVSSHGTIQGYNGQALVDSKKQVIVHAEAFGNTEDSYLIPPI